MDAQRCIEARILAQLRVIAGRLALDPEAVLAHAPANLARWSVAHAEVETLRRFPLPA